MYQELIPGIPEGFKPYPKYPDRIAVHPEGRVINLDSMTYMLPWENEEDNGRLWISMRVIDEPHHVKDIEVAIWKLVDVTFGENKDAS